MLQIVVAGITMCKKKGGAMTKCYVVIAGKGGYNNYHEWPVGVFASKEKAISYVLSKEGEYREHCPLLNIQYEKEYYRLCDIVDAEGSLSLGSRGERVSELIAPFEEQMLKDNPGKTWDLPEERVHYRIEEVEYEGL